jgi:hypothetical protein
VEVLLDPGASNNMEWVRFEDFINEHFRFAAAVVPAQNHIYTFGGQLPYMTSRAIAFPRVMM